MRKLALALVVAFSVAGCAQQWQQFSAAWDTLTGARVSPNAVYVAENAANAVTVVATHYLKVCHTHKEYAACAKPIEVQVVDAVRALRTARRNLHSFMVAHPDALGASGLYDALKSTTASLNKIITDYNLASLK
jgi:hypothetical protein